MATSAKKPPTPPTDTFTVKESDDFPPAKVKETQLCKFRCLDSSTKEVCLEIKKLQAYFAWK